MNKIKIKNNDISLLETDDLIVVKLSDKLEIFDVKKMNIEVVGSTEIEIIYDEKLESKLDIEYNIDSNVEVKITEIRKEMKSKIQYKYNILENSNVKVIKFYDSKVIKELDIINLNGINSKIDYLLKTIATDKQDYNMYVYHNNKNTISNIKNNSVNINEGTTTFNITGVVYNGITNCTLNQINKIINLNDKECKINPNLLIEENDVVANHSALIGKFSEEEIFYLMSRGISKKDSINLLTKGFLMDGIQNETINKIIEKYSSWG